MELNLQKATCLATNQEPVRSIPTWPPQKKPLVMMEVAEAHDVHLTRAETSK